MLPKGVTRNTSKGRVYYRYRAKGVNYTFKSQPGSEAFLEEYNAIVSHKEPLGASSEKPGSFSALLARYYKSPLFLDLKPSTQQTYRLILEKFKDRFGEEAVIGFRPRHIRAIMSSMSDKPMAANNMLKRLRVVFGYAVDLDMRDDNPCTNIRLYKKKGSGHHSWTEEEIRIFEKKYQVGTTARLAFDLLLYTGQRRSDVVSMGWQHIDGARIKVRQQKGGAKVAVMMHKNLVQSLDHAKGNLTFLLTTHGKPFSAAGFGNKMRYWCDDAGLTHCSAHGLRKAAARRLAESGCSTHEIAAVTGHQTLSEVENYTREANRAELADAAVKKLSNFSNRLDKSSK